jgi:hypothetical protein
MSLDRLNGLMALALGLIPAMTEGSFGPGEAASHSASRGSGQRVAQNADFKVLVWYRKSDSINTFKYQIYDVRKGEYTAKIDEWVKDVQTKYPGYYVVLRDVDLKREKGETELLKVGSVIDRELIVAAGRAGIALGSGRRATSSPFFGLGRGAQNTGSKRTPGLKPSPGSSRHDRDFLTPSPTPFPVPVPFPHVPR